MTRHSLRTPCPFDEANQIVLCMPVFYISCIGGTRPAGFATGRDSSASLPPATTGRNKPEPGRSFGDELHATGAMHDSREGGLRLCSMLGAPGHMPRDAGGCLPNEMGAMGCERETRKRGPQLHVLLLRATSKVGCCRMHAIGELVVGGCCSGPTRQAGRRECCGLCFLRCCRPPRKIVWHPSSPLCLLTVCDASEVGSNRVCGLRLLAEAASAVGR